MRDDAALSQRINMLCLIYDKRTRIQVFALYLIGILAAVGTGLLLKHSLLRSKPTPYAMELPPYLLPTLRGVTIHGWERLKSFIISAGRIIVPMVVVINFLNAVGPDGSFSNQDSDKSILAAIGRAISPVFAPFGLREENWPATVGIFTGILAKEVIVGTLNATYSALTENTAGAKEEDGFDLGGTLAVAVATIPTNLANALGKWYDPLGIAVGELTDLDTEAERQGVEKVIFREMMTRFDGPAGAFAYLLFVLLYTPCTAALGAIYRESGARWMLFVATWTFGLAYGAATLYYQVATFAAHPLSSAVWIGAVGAVLATALVALRRYGQRREYQAIPLMPQAVASGCDGCNKAGLCGYK
ncbi:MAG: nucleoside recognition domain-containing protein, partial [Rhodocyclaceae bacterium]